MASKVDRTLQTIKDTRTILSNGTKGWGNANKFGKSIEDRKFTFLEKSQIAQGVSGSIATASDTAAMVAKSAPEPPANIAVASKALGAAGGVIAAWGVGNDSLQIYSDWKDEDKDVKASTSLSLLSNSLAVGASVAGLTGVGLPVAVGLGVASFGIGVASMLVDKDLTPNDMVVHGLGDLGDAIGDKVINLLDPPEELPEISGSQQNQLMAISKGPSFNYTSHKKDSVAGYTLYQMLDNAEDTVSSSSMNGFTVYVMGKTIQPTCQGDESGIGGGIKSGTVGKEVRATSGAPSIFYCGYMSIRADDTCTMNNENVEGKYISLC